MKVRVCVRLCEEIIVTLGINRMITKPSIIGAYTKLQQMLHARRDKWLEGEHSYRMDSVDRSWTKDCKTPANTVSE